MGSAYNFKYGQQYGNNSEASKYNKFSGVNTAAIDSDKTAVGFPLPEIKITAPAKGSKLFHKTEKTKVTKAKIAKKSKTIKKNSTQSEKTAPVTENYSTNLPARYRRAWDPRLKRLDMFFMNSKDGDVIIPFASNTASSAFFDNVYVAEEKVLKALKNAKNSKATSSTDTTTKKDANKEKSKSAANPLVDDTTATGQRFAAENENTQLYRTDKRFYGTASLINPYCITKLIGTLESPANEFYKLQDGTKVFLPQDNRFYDIRDQRRFYDITKTNANAEMVSVNGTSSNALDINNPTTTNIIKWSNQDLWGRTPYSFQDFVFCKYWNIIPNNRLITLRKFAAPTLDNLNFSGMIEDKTDGKRTPFAPLATAVTYFGEETENKLSSLLTFTTGVEWDKLESQVWKVGGDQGTEGNIASDKTLGKNGEKGALSEIFQSNKAMKGVLDKIQGGMQVTNNWGKFLGIATGTIYGQEQETWETLNTAQMDPYEEGPFTNRIEGPINRVNSVKKRKEGIVFKHDSLKIVCEYVARPIGGINNKVVINDILSNALIIGSANAVFWGGGYRFDVKARPYPWPTNSTNKNMLGALYKGQIFGKGGAIDTGLAGLKSFGNDSNGSFSWDKMLGNLGNVFGSLVGALGDVVSSAVGAVFGNAGGALEKLTGQAENGIASKTGGDTKEMEKGKKGLLGSVNSLWKNKLIQNTTYPSITGMRALLIGEPVGNWHLTIGNPLNPIAVIGNLICKDMQVIPGDELGPDDFPMSIKIEYNLEHGMDRDRAAIQSMFNRGAGKIYELPDYMQATSDQETKVDDYTGGASYRNKSFIGPTLYGVKTFGKSYSISSGKALSNTGDGDTTVLTSFYPVNEEAISGTLSGTYDFMNAYGTNSNNRIISAYSAHSMARKAIK